MGLFPRLHPIARSLYGEKRIDGLRNEAPSAVQQSVPKLDRPNNVQWRRPPTHRSPNGTAQDLGQCVVAAGLCSNRSTMSAKELQGHAEGRRCEDGAELPRHDEPSHRETVRLTTCPNASSWCAPHSLAGAGPTAQPPCVEIAAGLSQGPLATKAGAHPGRLRSRRLWFSPQPPPQRQQRSQAAR